MSEEDNHPIVYEALDQNMGTAAPAAIGYSLMVHYQGNGAEVASALRNEVHSVDSSLGIFSEKEMVDRVTDSLIIPRAESAIFGTFGFVGLLLAAVGLYGVMSYSVQRRTQEIGIRLALGATRGRVQGLIVRQGMMLALVALGIGLPLALGASKIAARLQHGIAAYDAVSFTLMPVFLAAVARPPAGFRRGVRLRWIRRWRCGMSTGLRCSYQGLTGAGSTVGWCLPLA